MIKRTDENGQEKFFINIKEASKSVESKKYDGAQIQFIIAGAILFNKRAFTYRWENVK